MTEPGLRERKNARTKSAIERAALELALEQGWERTTVDQIAERADVSPRTVYVRYTTKDAVIFDELQGDDGFAAVLASGQGDIVDRILGFARTSRPGSSSETPELARLRMRAVLTDPLLRERFRTRLDEGEKLIATQAARDARIPDDDVAAQVFAAAVMRYFIALMERFVAGDDPEAVLESAESGVHVLRAALHALQATPQQATGTQGGQHETPHAGHRDPLGSVRPAQ